MTQGNPDLDSAEKIVALEQCFNETGTLPASDLQFVFTYLHALEIALEFSAGAGLTQAESDALEESNADYHLSSYLIEGVSSKEPNDES